MGCTCQRNNTMKNDKPKSFSETPETRSRNSIKNNNFNRAKTVTDEEEILIFSEMLVNENKGDVLKFYVPMETIGEGSFGKVFKVKQRSTGHTFAMKLVSKDSELGNKNFLNEIYILRKLDHPNILKIYEYFSNEKYWYFVMEYVSGGELYEQICNMNYYDENKAAIIMKQIFSCVSYLNQMGIVHRDLKPENMMMTNKKDYLDIKLIDFGTATFLKKGRKLKNKIGSPYYIAPEVIKGNYDEKCDLWSCGVILYILLVGYPPFDGKNPNEIFQNISKCDYKINGEDWDNISEDAKDLLKQLLHKNPSQRITAAEALKHSWIIKNSIMKKTENTNFNKISLKNCLQTFSSKQKLHQASVAFIVHQMSNTKMVQKLTEIFKELDESGEGLLSKEELKKGYKKFFTDSLTDSEFDEIMKTIDQDKSGQISIEEFLRATVNYENLVTEKNLKYAFEYFDKDHSGFLSPDEIREVLGLNDENEETNRLVNEIIKDVDINGDGQISYEEFKTMMKRNQNLITG